MGDGEGQAALGDMVPENYCDSDADGNVDESETEEDCYDGANIDQDMELDDDSEYPGLT